MKKYSFIFSYFKKRNMIVLISMMLLASILSLCPPYMISYILDNGVVRASQGTIISGGIFLICIYVGIFFVHYFISQTLTRASSYFIADLKNDLFMRILKLPMEFFDNKQTGYVLERMKETDALNVFFSPVFLKFVTSVFSCIGAFALILSIRWELALVLLVFLPAIYYFTNYSSLQIKKASKALFESNAQTSGKVQENISGISAVKEMKMEQQCASEISKQLKTVADRSVQRGKMMNLASEGILGISNISSVILVVLSGLFIVNGKMSLGNYWAVSQYAMLVFAPVQLLSSISIMVQPGIAALSRIGELLKLKTEEEVSGDKKTGRIEDIVCSDVSFAYTERPVIRNFNMRAHRNTKIVLSGKNGSGKTTVAKLLLGFYKNYSGSLLDNIRYISPDLKEQEITAALKKAGLTISEFENGLHFMVNENGKNLSGGQRQKIALARMIVKNPDVMIFDEATSNLDVTASNLLKQSVHSIFADKICIIITHDPEMASIVDTILNLSDECNICS